MLIDFFNEKLARHAAEIVRFEPLDNYPCIRYIPECERLFETYEGEIFALLQGRKFPKEHFKVRMLYAAIFELAKRKVVADSNLSQDPIKPSLNGMSV